MTSAYGHLRNLLSSTNRIDYIEEQCERIAELYHGNYYSIPLDLRLRRDIGPLGEKRERNIYLEVPGNSNVYRTYVAHHDYVGGGAVDNGSGVALLLSFAEEYGRHRFGQEGVRLLFTSGEEGSQKISFGLTVNGIISNLMIAGLPSPRLINFLLAGILQKSDLFRLGLRGARQDVKRGDHYKRSLEEGGILAVDSIGYGEFFMPWNMGDATLFGLFSPIRTDPELNIRLLKSYQNNQVPVTHGHLAVASCDAVPYLECGVPAAAMLRLGKIPYHTEGDSLDKLDTNLFSNLMERGLCVLECYHKGEDSHKIRQKPYSSIRIFNSGDRTRMAGYYVDQIGTPIIEVLDAVLHGEQVVLREDYNSQNEWYPIPPSVLGFAIPEIAEDITPRRVKFR
jgi:hypothetical protein